MLTTSQGVLLLNEVGAGGVPFVESLPRYCGKNRPGDGCGSRSPLLLAVGLCHANNGCVGIGNDSK